MAVEQLAIDIQDFIENDEIEEAHQQLLMMLDDGHFDDVRNLLHWAINNNNIQMVEILIHNIISPNIRLLNGRYPLDIAIENDNFDMVRTLLYNGANPNLEHSHALNIAVNKDNIDIVNELLQYEADPNKRGKLGKPPLFNLKYKGANRVEIAKMLINAGADVTLTIEEGRPLLNYFSRRQDYDMVKFLLNMNLNPNVRDNTGDTPLIDAFDYYPNPKLIQLLIHFGADPNIPNNSGATPFTILRESNYQASYSQKLLDILNSFEELQTLKEPEFQ